MQHHITKLKIGFTAALVVLLGVLLFVGQPIGTTFANGNGLQLTIDSHSIYNDVFQEQLSWELRDLVPGVDHFFNFGDIKPGDTGENTISIHVEENPAYVCLDFYNLKDDENGTTEPESLVDITPGGELSSAIEFFGWRDDGDNIFELGERPLFGTDEQSALALFSTTTYPLADESTDEVFLEGETYYVGITWCAGDLTVDLDTALVSCDPIPMGNEYQTDSFSVDISLRAVEASAFTNYLCEDPGVDLYLNKQISGDDQGFELSQFSYHVVGGDIDAIVPHDHTVRLPIGTYTIEELVPEGFNKEDWRIGWYGQCESGDTFMTTITVDEGNVDHGTLYCEADNQYRPGVNAGRFDTVVAAEETSESETVTEAEEVVETTTMETAPPQRWSVVRESDSLISSVRTRSR